MGEQPTLFISYSHAARQHMLLFRKHLEGLLFAKALVWSDQAIPRGDRWETKLRARLQQADAALVLVTPDFMSSAWCRRELTTIAQLQKAGTIKKVFWVLVEPSGWRGTELATFQSWAFNLDEALTEIADLNARTRAMVRICEEIAAEMEELRDGLDSDLLFVRRVILDKSIAKGLEVDSPIPGGQGAFATVCRGRQGGEDVAIKVFKQSLIKQLSESFSQSADARQRLTNQCFIRVLDQFPVETGHDQYTVVVEEFVGSGAIQLDQYLIDHKPPIDEVAIVIRRAAEAIKQFHDELPEATYGLLAPRHVYYDERGQKLRLPALGVSNFLWSTLGWERLSTWQDKHHNSAAYVAPEQVGGLRPTQKTDQYMLGQLAFEMLEGKLPFTVHGPTEIGKKEAFWKDPRTTVKGKWPRNHQAFANIIFRMLEREPQDRWESLDELIKRLRTMEDENRALAKRTYEGLDEYGFKLKDNVEFFKSFYHDFFLVARDAKAKFADTKDQPKKLMEAIVAVLNFRVGNEPTALRAIVSTHLNYKITESEVEQFGDAFIGTLKKKLPRRIPASEREKILTAWRDLFSPVVAYLKEELKIARRKRRGD